MGFKRERESISVGVEPGTHGSGGWEQVVEPKVSQELAACQPHPAEVYRFPPLIGVCSSPLNSP